MQYAEDVYEQDDEFVNGELPNFRLQATGFDATIEDSDQGSRAITQSDQTPVTQEYKYNLPEVIKNFITYFLRHIKEPSVHEIHNLYENSFNKLTEKYFKSSPWPSVEAIKTIVDPERGEWCSLFFFQMYAC